MLDLFYGLVVLLVSESGLVLSRRWSVGYKVAIFRCSIANLCLGLSWLCRLLSLWFFGFRLFGVFLFSRLRLGICLFLFWFYCFVLIANRIAPVMECSSRWEVSPVWELVIKGGSVRQSVGVRLIVALRAVLTVPFRLKGGRRSVRVRPIRHILLAVHHGKAGTEYHSRLKDFHCYDSDPKLL